MLSCSGSMKSNSDSGVSSKIASRRRLLSQKTAMGNSDMHALTLLAERTISAVHFSPMARSETKTSVGRIAVHDPRFLQSLRIAKSSSYLRIRCQPASADPSASFPAVKGGKQTLKLLH
jgi:hypothetical protein